MRRVLSEQRRRRQTADGQRREISLDDFSAIEPADSPEHDDAFYAAWAEELLQSVADDLLEQYHGEGRGDYFRVLFGRVCEQMSNREVAASLRLSETQAENYYKHARKRLESLLDQFVRRHVEQYSPAEGVAEEFTHEWRRLGEFLQNSGGLEAALKRSLDGLNSSELKRRQSKATTTIMHNMRDLLVEER